MDEKTVQTIVRLLEFQVLLDTTHPYPVLSEEIRERISHQARN
jgi:precorrin-6x reductase